MPVRRAQRPGHDGDNGTDNDNDSGRMQDSSEGSGSGRGEGHEEEEEEGSSESSTVQARSGITYELVNLDADSEARALLGLTGRFDVVNCQTTQTGYDFQLSERPRVHLGSDTYTCTCSSFQSRPDVACQHIFVSLTFQRKESQG